MRVYYYSLLYLFLTLSVTTFSQPTKEPIRPFIETSYGYVNNELMIDGYGLSSEFGIDLSNNYSFSIKCSFSELKNDKANSFPVSNLITKDLIITSQLFSFHIGYDLKTKNNRHHFSPKIGPFYGFEHIQTIHANNQNIELSISPFESVGAELILSYYYSFKSGLYVGLCGSVYSAYQYGFIYYYAGPIVGIRLNYYQVE